MDNDRSGTVVRWQPVPGATSYDVIRGLVNDLTDSGNEYDLGSVSCIEAASIDESTVGHEDTAVPAKATAFFYLVEYQETGGTSSSFSTESALKPRVPMGSACDSP